jgi:ribosomal protein S3
LLERQYVGNRYSTLLHDESEIRKTIRYTVENTERLVMFIPRQPQKVCVTVVLIAHDSGDINSSNLISYQVEVDVN